MPESGRDTVSKDVLYPDDLTGETLIIDPADRMNGEMLFWNAEDEGDSEDLPDDARYGYFFPAIHPEHGEIWVSAPRELREVLVDKINPGDEIEVLSLEKGPGETDPYMAEVAIVHD